MAPLCQPRSKASTHRIVGKWRATSRQLSPSSALAKTDPVFVPKGRDQTFAEIAPEEKHAISHRADAFAKLVTEQFS